MLLVVAFSTNAQDKKARIDSHIHLYDTNREGSYAFLDGQKENPNTGLFVPHLQQQFLNAAQPSGFEYTYVVEASNRREDNFWLSEIADTSGHVIGFTANLNPLDRTFVADLDSLKQNPKFRGVRPRINGLDLSETEVLNNLGELYKRNLVLELNSLMHVDAIAKKYPNLHIVINHFGSVRLKDGVIPDEENYKRSLKEIAAHKNVFMKISALHTISGKNTAPTNVDYYKPLLDAALDAFGPDRVIYGSNWPLSGLRGNYNNAVNILEQYCASRSDLTEEKLFFKNVIRAYGLMKPTISK